MLKQSVSIGLLFLLISCGQKPNNKSQETSTDSLTQLNTTTDTLRNHVTSPVKREAYKENIHNLPVDLIGFVFEGYTALDTIYGDLNLDQYPDVIMVLKKNGEDTTSEAAEYPAKRPLLILIGQEDKIYKLAARSDNAVYCIGCGGMMGDPFMNVVIKKGYFSIEHYGGSGWRWTRTITFKYLPADSYWYLHKDGHENFHVNNPEKVETKIYTTKDFGKVPFDKFDIYK